MGKPSRRTRAAQSKKELTLDMRNDLTKSILATLAQNGITFASEPEGMAHILSDIRKYKEGGGRLEAKWGLPIAGGNLSAVLPRYQEEEPMLKYSAAS